ncbi:hypothetical protein ACIPLC_11200 [Kitasatospora sp. NPDC086801]|uniref:hypothetical protein n=1 Tax=Kitasatospora sp. NPDC086801 TaxID=3364066 RepID=UPI0037F39273
MRSFAGAADQERQLASGVGWFTFATGGGALLLGLDGRWHYGGWLGGSSNRTAGRA